MPVLTSIPRNAITDAMKAEARAIAAGLRRAVERTGRQVQEDLRAQVRSAGFKDGGRAMANAWRLKTFPAAGVVTFRPAALVFSKMPEAVQAFDRGEPIVARKRKYLAFPTGYNARGGRRSAGSRGGVRVTTQGMIAAGSQAFILRAKSNRSVFLWCLRVNEARGMKRRGRNRLRLFVGDATEVLTGHRKGQQAMAREVLDRGFVPMFVLVRQVVPRKRLDVDAVRDHAVPLLLTNVLAELKPS